LADRLGLSPNRNALFALLEAKRCAGVCLTETYAMWPGSSVSGLYFSRPESRYFGTGKIERGQVEDYARRMGWPVGEAERWLAPLLNYDPRAAAAWGTAIGGCCRPCCCHPLT
jgi:5-methyltetrahydrofolate--homocysteine methyltransferase